MGADIVIRRAGQWQQLFLEQRHPLKTPDGHLLRYLGRSAQRLKDNNLARRPQHIFELRGIQRRTVQWWSTDLLPSAGRLLRGLEAAARAHIPITSLREKKPAKR
jgi:hypothetical protein